MARSILLRNRKHDLIHDAKLRLFIPYRTRIRLKEIRQRAPASTLPLVKSLVALRNAALETAKAEGSTPLAEMALICADLVLHIEGLQRQLDEMKRHDTRRRAGL